MFRNRTSQKPSDDFYLNFKADFPALGQGPASTTTASQAATSLAQTSDNALHPSSLEQHDVKDADPTPRASNEPWNFGTSGLTPSIMDPLSHHFSMFSHQAPGYYTPTPGGTNTLYHHQAGDLHTPRFGIGPGTPLSMPTSEGTLHAGHQVAGFQGFNPHFDQHVQQQHFQNIDPFHMNHTSQQQQTFPPHHFTRQPSYEHLDPSIGSPLRELELDMDMQQSQHQSPAMLMHSQNLQQTMQPPPRMHLIGEKFRYHVTLNAPTAMIKHVDEIPVTYLNKGQAYTLNVVDTHLQQLVSTRRYRTFVRISFEDEQQRQRPSACWQLWKEGRGTNEAHQRGGRLQAVEYVESTPFGSAEDPSKPRIEIESASFDGFCVTWSPGAGTAECPISVRFNFLSTDFSHSKGVKGIPVRLCAKTELIGDLSPAAGPSESEVCYCKVKLFRDHGAERKLSNDVVHVKKTIDKMNQQIAQIESGIRDSGKRKRSGSISKAGNDQRPGKMPKHRRTWSMSSAVSNAARGSAEEDLHMKLMTLQDMFTSPRPASVLYLKGAAEDDPDLNPVRLTGEPLSLVGNESTETASWGQRSTETGPPSSLVSPSPSSNSVSGSRRDSNLQQPTPFGGISRVASAEWRSRPQMATADIQQKPDVQQLASPPDNQAVKIQTRSPNTGTLSGWIEALEVDSSYQSPPEKPIKPVACFYVQPRIFGQAPPDNFYRAIYLMSRTSRDLGKVLATKCKIEPTQVLRIVRITRQGLHVLFDDDCVRELPEGQDMTAEFCKITPESPMKANREREGGPTDIQCDGDVAVVENVVSTGYELKLLF